MARLPEFFRKNGVPYIFDPGQQIPVLSPEILREAIQGSFALVANDYEVNMICKATGLTEDEILGRTLWLITTLGAAGIRVSGADGTDITLPAIPVKSVIDPTGAGDAQRGGLLKGLAAGASLLEAVKLSAVAASFAIEKLGTQEHAYTKDEFAARYERSFGKLPVEL